MPAIFLTADLMFLSRVVGAAKELEKSIAVVSTVETLVARCAEEAVPLVLVDLSLTRLEPADLMARLRALPSPPQAIVAYAPHVHEKLLAAAESAGCTEVLTRGQFSAQIERVMTQYIP